MRVWMLTGDKGATAKQIAYSCGLLTQKSESTAQQPVPTSLKEFHGAFAWLNKFNNNELLDRTCLPIE